MTENFKNCNDNLSTSSYSCCSCCSSYNSDFQQILKLLEEQKNDKLDFQFLFDKLEVLTVKEEIGQQEIIKELQELNEKTSGNQKILEHVKKITFQEVENKKLNCEVEQQKIFIKKLEEDKLTKDQVIKTMTENAEDNIREKNLTLLELVKKEEEMDKIREEGDEYFNKLSVSNDKLEESSKKINILEEENKKLNKNMSQLKKDIFQNKKNYEQEIQKFTNMADKLSKINLNLKEDKDEVNKKNKDLLEKNEQLQSQLKNCYKLIQEKNKKICSFEMQAKKLEKEKNDLSIKNVELKTQLVEVYKKIGEKITFMKRPNEFCTIKIYSCCNNNCINSNLSDGICINGNGYINVHKNEITYNNSLTGGENKWIFIHSRHPFAKTSGFSNNYSLFYFEVTIYNEGNDSAYAGIGVGYNYGFDVTPVAKIYLCNINDSYCENCSKYEWKNGDVFGCGIVFPPKNDSKTKAYGFFTKNGNKIGKNILLENDEINFYPFIGLSSCSAKTNFGSEATPFMYDVNKHVH